jgi:hypothetical protein
MAFSNLAMAFPASLLSDDNSSISLASSNHAFAGVERPRYPRGADAMIEDGPRGGASFFKKELDWLEPRSGEAAA